MNLLRHNRSLLILGLAEAISNVGNWVTMMALFAIVMFRGDGGVLESSGILLAGLGPMIVTGPIAGWLGDRFDRRRLMIAAQFLSALPVLGLVVAGDGLWIYPLLAIQAATLSIMMPARQAALPTLVERDRLAQANAFLQQLSGLVKIAAPMLGGALVAAIGPHPAMVLDVASFFLAAAVLWLLPALPPPPPAETGGQEAALSERSALGALRAGTRLRLLFITIFFTVLVIMGFDVLAPVTVRDLFGGDERLFGLAIGLVGLGTVLSSLLIMLRRRKREPWYDLVTGVVLLALLPGAIAFAAWLGGPDWGRWLLLAGGLFGGLGSGFVVVQVGTLLQLLAPAAVLGSLSGLFQSTVTAAQLITIILMPLLIPRWLDVATFFTISTAGLFLLVLLVTLRLRMAPLPRQPGELPALPRLSQK